MKVSPSTLDPAGNAAHPALDPLTPRERDVLRLIGQGLSSAAVATVLGLSKRTVDFHLDNAYDKFGVRSRMAALREAARRGISLDDPKDNGS
jgi:DNA-binding CsgD family transcriptional regulator